MRLGMAIAAPSAPFAGLSRCGCGFTPSGKGGRAGWRLGVSARAAVSLSFKGVSPPAGGWTAQTFAAHGHALITGFVRLSKAVQRKAMPVLAQTAHRMLMKRVNAVRDLAMRHEVARRKGYAVAVEVQQAADVWRDAIQSVFDERNIDAVVDLIPPIQSVMAQGYSKTGSMLGLNLPNDGSNFIVNRTRKYAARFAGMDATTSSQFRDSITAALNTEGVKTPFELSQWVYQRMEGFSRNRALTIGRTESMNAWNEGSVAALQQSETLTHVSVIGCESREQEALGRPSYQQFMYRGESTCNIEDVPIADADKLNFHPNHTGVVVPSAFRDEDSNERKSF
jgi:hypothetical protein